LAVNAFGGLWRRQPEGWAHRVLRHEYPDVELRRTGLDAHAGILDAVASGDAEKAEVLTLEHIRHPRVRQVKEALNTVRATEMARRG
jgi:DNA-binding GntR family transcriptional regulator